MQERSLAGNAALISHIATFVNDSWERSQLACVCKLWRQAVRDSWHSHTIPDTLETEFTLDWLTSSAGPPAQLRELIATGLQSISGGLCVLLTCSCQDMLSAQICIHADTTVLCTAGSMTPRSDTFASSDQALPVACPTRPLHCKMQQMSSMHATVHFLRDPQLLPLPASLHMLPCLADLHPTFADSCAKQAEPVSSCAGMMPNDAGPPQALSSTACGIIPHLTLLTCLELHGHARPLKEADIQHFTVRSLLQAQT